jgi:hypothetical protein
MQVASVVQVLQALSVAGSITEEDSYWLSSCGLSAEDVENARHVSLESGLGEELWCASERHAISLMCAKRCDLFDSLSISQKCSSR